MKGLLNISILLGVILTIGCADHPYTGYYRSNSEEWIILEKNGAVSWTNDENFVRNDHFMGILSNPDRDDKMHFVMPSASPYVGTSIEIDEENELLKVNWYDARPETQVEFASEYHRQ